MEQINYNKIFQILSEDNYKESETSYDDLRNHPIFFLGMYKKCINYKPLSSDKINKYLKAQFINLNPDEVAKAGKVISYNRSWEYISKFNVNNDFHIEKLIEYSNPDLIDSLNKGIKFFEKTTEYEKCAFLKKILDSIPISEKK